MGFKFTPEMFSKQTVGSSQLSGKIVRTPSEASDLAQAALDAHLKACPVVYGSRNQAEWTSYKMDSSQLIAVSGNYKDSFYKGIVMNVEPLAPKDERVSKGEIASLLDHYHCDQELRQVLFQILKHGIRE